MDFMRLKTVVASPVEMVVLNAHRFRNVIHVFLERPTIIMVAVHVGLDCSFQLPEITSDCVNLVHHIATDVATVYLARHVKQDLTLLLIKNAFAPEITS